MNGNDLKYRGEYFKTITKIVVILAIASIVTGSVSMFFFSKKMVDKGTHENTVLMLKQIQNDANSVDRLISNFAGDLLNDKDIYNLLNSYRSNQEEYYHSFYKIMHGTLYTNGLINEVYVYNVNSGRVYSTSGYLTLKEAGLNEVIVRDGGIRKGVPVFRTANQGKNKGKTVCTFFYSNKRLGVGYNESFLAIDIAIDEILGNFANSLAQKDNEVILTDSNYTVQWESGSENENVHESKLGSIEKLVKKAKLNDNYKIRQNGVKYMVTAVTYDKYDWVIIYITSMQGMYSQVGIMSLCWLGITGILVIIGVILAKRAAHYIYLPVQDTMIQLKDVIGAESGAKQEYQELQLMKQSILNSQKKLKNLEQNQWKEKRSRSNAVLRKLLEQSLGITEEQISLLNEVFDSNLQLDAPSLLGVIQFPTDCCPAKEDEEVFLPIIENVFAEKLRERFDHLICVIANQSVVFVVNQTEQEQENTAYEIIKDAKQIFEEISGQRINITASRIYAMLSDTSEQYQEILLLSRYHLLELNHHFITPQIVQKNQENPVTRYSGKLDEKLREAIFVRNRGLLEEVLDDICKELSQLKYDNMIGSLLHFIDYTQELADEINSSKLFPVTVDLGPLREQIFRSAVLSEMVQQYRDSLKEFMIKEENKKDHTQVMMLETVKTYIDENYANPDLCAQSIADKFKLSAKYLSYSFKEYTKESLLVYLQKKRLEAACGFLENTTLSISDIVFRIGLENENYFYTLFKKNMGVTPKQYRQSKIKL